MKLFKPRFNKWLAGLSAIILGAANITAPINLHDMLPEFIRNPILGNFSIIQVAAYGAVIGGYFVLTKNTE